MTPEQMATTIKSALTAALPTGVSALDYDEVPGDKFGHIPGTPPASYVVIDISRRYTEERRASGEVVLPGYRLGTRYCAKTVTDVRELQRRVKVTLESQILSGDLGPFDFEVEAEPIHMDALGFTGVDDWTF